MRLDTDASAVDLDLSGLRIAVVRSRFNAAVTDGLLQGAFDWLEAAGVESVTVVDVPGAFELPVAARALCAHHDAVVALGAVIEGETDHYHHIARTACDGLMRVMLDTGVPVGLGLLTVRQPSHAVARAAPGPENKGAEAAAAAATTAALLHQLAETAAATTGR
ncbi:MAG: 6,7-dimethyl-8-ribityllumazine synthase [Actinomycetota bacterium]|nr:6,7-dimethyl-8-ribityllumazine synthase [Actinomycetota bacterium]